jgi:hypothetical protein
VFSKVYINFLIVRHTHDDMDTLFRRWSWKPKTNNNPTLPMLIKLFKDIERKVVIPHLIEEVPMYLCCGNDAL